MSSISISATPFPFKSLPLDSQNKILSFLSLAELNAGGICLADREIRSLCNDQINSKIRTALDILHPSDRVNALINLCIESRNPKFGARISPLISDPNARESDTSNLAIHLCLRGHFLHSIFIADNIQRFNQRDFCYEDVLIRAREKYKKKELTDQDYKKILGVLENSRLSEDDLDLSHAEYALLKSQS